MWGLRFPALLVACLFFLEVSADVEVALSSNDECAGDTCALNALQTRQRTASSEAPEENESVNKIDGAFVVCDPLCHDGEAESDDLTLHSSWRGRYIRHYGRHCWSGCGHAGNCNGFCGNGNACCKYGDHRDPPECNNVRKWPTMQFHTCVAPSQSFPSHSHSHSCNTRSMGGKTMTVYHQTGCDIGPKILASGFRLGKVGWCAGAIYFAMTPEETGSKATGPDSHTGFMIEATVAVGNVAKGDSLCRQNGKHWNARTTHDAGFDSVMFDPHDGMELVVYCASQVISMKKYPWKCS